MARHVDNSQIAARDPSNLCEPLTGDILVVDDDPGMRNLLMAILAEAGIACCAAANGEEAVKTLQTGPFKGVLADLQMPGISGMELLTEIKSRFPYLAFVMVTGVDDVRVGIEAMKQGADDYLVKPLQSDAVLASLHRALRRKELEFELNCYRERLERMVEERTEQLAAALLQIESSYSETLQALGAAIDLRDGETAGHSRRVAAYSVRIAKELNSSEQELKTIEMGAWLHDIGKLAIPDAILLKPGALTADEWVVMRSHVQIGYDLIRRIPFLGAAAEIVLTHHERCDGSGYPRGLSGKRIPFGARVFAVADTVDAMTSNRPYRLALPLEDACAEIQDGLGTRYDCEVASTFLGISIEEWKAVRSQSADFEENADRERQC